MPAMDVEPDLAGPYSHPQGDEQSGPGPVPGLLCPPCPWAPHPALLLPARQRNKLCPQRPQRHLHSPAWAEARPQCQGAPTAPQQASHHAHAPRHPFPALVPGRAQGTSPCPWATWHLGSQARADRPPAQPGTAPWLCLAWLCPVSHSSLISSGTWGLQCHAQAGHSLMRLPVQAGCPPIQELAVGLLSWHRAPAAYKGSQSHHTLTGAPGFNPCHTAAHHQAAPAEQAGRAGCTFTLVLCPTTCPPCPACHSHRAESVVTGSPRCRTPLRLHPRLGHHVRRDGHSSALASLTRS